MKRFVVLSSVMLLMTVTNLNLVLAQTNPFSQAENLDKKEAGLKEETLMIENPFRDQRGGAKLTVLSPKTLHSKLGNYTTNDNSMRVSLGNFGHIRYGSSVSGELVYFEGSDDERTGCAPYTTFFKKNSLVLVDAGSCTITTKVRNIENAGGQVALIADAFQENVDDVWVEDLDGNGFSLVIPGLLISRDDAAVLKESFMKGESIKMAVSLEIAKTQQKIAEVTLWYGSILDFDPRFIEDLYDYVHLMQNFIHFSPRVITLECPNCIGQVRDRECYSDGLFCLMPPHQTGKQQFPEISDRELLEENLRERCVHAVIQEDIQKKHGIDTPSRKDDIRFFNYIYLVRRRCLNVHRRFHPQCINKVLDELQLDAIQVQWCMSTSFETFNPDDSANQVQAEYEKSPNMFMFEDKVYSEVYGISKHPSITINGQIFKGDFDGYDVYKAICASFTPGNTPYECKEDFDVTQELGQAQYEFVKISHGRMHLRVVLIAFTFLIFFYICVYRRCTRRRMQEEVAEEVSKNVSKYFALQGTEDVNSSTETNASVAQGETQLNQI